MSNSYKKMLKKQEKFPKKKDRQNINFNNWNRSIWKYTKEPSMIPEHILWVFWHLQVEITSLNLRSNQLTFLNLLRSASINSEGKIPFRDFTKTFFSHIYFFLTCCMTHPSHPPWFITPITYGEHFPPLTHQCHSYHPVLKLLQSTLVPQLRTSCPS